MLSSSIVNSLQSSMAGMYRYGGNSLQSGYIARWVEGVDIIGESSITLTTGTFADLLAASWAFPDTTVMRTLDTLEGGGVFFDGSDTPIVRFGIEWYELLNTSFVWIGRRGIVGYDETQAAKSAQIIRYLGAPDSDLYLGQVATHAGVPTSSVDSAQQIMSRSYHVTNQDLTGMRLVFDSFYGEEVAHGGDATIKASIEYPAGTFTLVTFAVGAASGTIPSGSNIISDVVDVDIPANAAFYVRSFLTSATRIVYRICTNQVAAGLGEGAQYGVTTPDLTAGGAVAQRNIVYTPSAIIAPTRKDSVLVLGDSRNSPGKDSGTVGNTNYGQVSPVLFNLKIPFISAAIPGGTAGVLAGVNGTIRCVLSNYTNKVICACGENDRKTNTTSQVLALLASVRARLNTRNTVHQTTITPYTTSTDSWATVENQTISYASTYDTLNAAIRAGISGNGSFIEITRLVESTTDSGKWTPGYTADGEHENHTACAAIHAIVVMPTFV